MRILVKRFAQSGAVVLLCGFISGDIYLISIVYPKFNRWDTPGFINLCPERAP